MSEEWISTLNSIKETICSMEVKGFNNAACIVLAVQKIDRLTQAIKETELQNGE